MGIIDKKLYNTANLAYGAVFSVVNSVNSGVLQQGCLKRNIGHFILMLLCCYYCYYYGALTRVNTVITRKETFTIIRKKKNSNSCYIFGD